MRSIKWKIIASLSLATSLLMLSGCGVLTETNFPGCDPTGSIKTYRGVGCARICKSEYSHCTNGKVADPDNDCQCTSNPVSIPQKPVPEVFMSSCACYYEGNPNYVNLHRVNCPSWLSRIPEGASKVAIGRPVGAGEDSSCTNICQNGNGKEIRGTFQIKTRGAGSCLQGAAIFPGNIYVEYVSGGQIVSSDANRSEFFAHLPKDTLARAEYRIAHRDGELAAKPGGLRKVQFQTGNASATSFKMRELNVDCRSECANGGQYCAEFQVDEQNARAIRESLTTLPAAATQKTITLSSLRQNFGNVSTACTHPSVDFDNAGSLRATGAACAQPLYLSMPGVEDFKASISIPNAIAAEYSVAGENRQMVFTRPEAMLALSVQPDTLQRLYGGKIRMASLSAERLVFETQNYCLAIKLP